MERLRLRETLNGVFLFLKLGGIKMKKNQKNLIFMISILVLVIGSLVTLNFLTNKQTETKQNEFVTDDKGNVEKVTIDYSDITEEITVDGLDLTNQPYLGATNAPVKVVEFGDFKCPACATWKQSVFPTLYDEYIKTGDVQFYFINFQFIAPDSILAGIAGEAIFKQSPEAFWQYYTKIYDNQPQESLTWATKTYLKKFVKENVDGIDYEKFNKDLDDELYLVDVKKDFLMAQKSGINSTPSVLVNGVPVQNDYNTIKSAIEKSLPDGN